MLKYYYFLALLFPALSLSAQVRFSPDRLIDQGPDRPRGMDVADFDNDGDLDVLGDGYIDGIITWYPNEGGRYPARRTVSTGATGVEEVHAADMDGDGWMDVLAASRLESSVSYYRNLGGGIFAPPMVISSTAMGCIDVYAADLDNDNDLDIISASLYDSKIAWYENLGGAMTWSAEKVIEDSALAARTCFAADLNGDSLIDVLSGSRADAKLSYYLNLGAGVFGPRVNLTDTAYGARDIKAIDLDSDGDLDIIGAAYESDRILWFENITTPGGPLTYGDAIALITNIEGPRSVDAADLDGDGDMDVLSGSEFDFRVAWYENLGGPAETMFGPMQTITSRLEGVRMVIAADVDQDGDPDVIGAGSYINRYEWFENLGNSAVPLDLSEFAYGAVQPVDMSFIPGDPEGYLAVAEKRGTIRLYDEDAKNTSGPMLDLRDRISTLPDLGLMSLAFPPDHAVTGRFYVSYVNLDTQVVLSRFFRSVSSPDLVDASSEEVLLTARWPIEQDAAANLEFGTDGYLYVGIGDGAVSPSWKLAQEPAFLQGKILALDVSIPVGYAIPPGNPGTLRPASADEIWAAGVHQPSGLSFDSETGDLWFADLGLSAVDEVNWQPTYAEKGANFGWPCMEGTDPLSTIGDCGPLSHYLEADFTAPISGDRGLTGGVFSKAPGIPAYMGQYVAADYTTGDWFWLQEEDTAVSVSSLLDSYAAHMSSFAQNAAGEIYASDDQTGIIYRLDQRCGPDVPVTGVRHRTYAGSLYVRWDAMPGANSYRIQISRSDTGGARSRYGTRNIIRLNSLAPGYTYTFRVQASCKDFSLTDVSAWSDYDTFDLPAPRIAAEHLETLQVWQDAYSIHVDLPGEGYWELIDLWGRRLDYGSQSAGRLELSTTALPAGSYILAFMRSDGSQRRVARFVTSR